MVNTAKCTLLLETINSQYKPSIQKRLIVVHCDFHGATQNDEQKSMENNNDNHQQFKRQQLNGYLLCSQNDTFSFKKKTLVKHISF